MFCSTPPYSHGHTEKGFAVGTLLFLAFLENLLQGHMQTQVILTAVGLGFKYIRTQDGLEHFPTCETSGP